VLVGLWNRVWLYGAFSSCCTSASPTYCQLMGSGAQLACRQVRREAACRAQERLPTSCVKWWRHVSIDQLLVGYHGAAWRATNCLDMAAHFSGWLPSIACRVRMPLGIAEELAVLSCLPYARTNDVRSGVAGPGLAVIAACLSPLAAA
jgi:hypothetical protein